VWNISLSNTYHQSSKTRLWRFIEAMEGRTEVLRRSRLFFADTKTAFMMLYDEYGTLSGSKHYRAEIDRLKKMASKYNLVMRLKMAVYVNDEKLMRKITGSSNAKTVEGALKMIVSEYEQLTGTVEKETGSGGFESTLVEISKYMGFRIDVKSVTVAEFASMLKNYNREIEYQKKSLKNGK
jgi:hypothetical protein